jgi:hypothetical protein
VTKKPSSRVWTGDPRRRPAAKAIYRAFSTGPFRGYTCTISTVCDVLDLRPADVFGAIHYLRGHGVRVFVFPDGMFIVPSDL